MRHCRSTILAATLCALAAVLSTANLWSGEPTREGGWLIERDERSGLKLYTMEMTLHPKPEPRPALKYHLIPDQFDMLDGNAAIFYLMAMGYLEQDPAHKRLFEIYDQAGDRSRQEGKDIHQVPPMSWLTMTPGELPLEEVKKFLKLTSFQRSFLAEARRRERFDMERNVRTVDDPIAFLLPEMQLMRELARTQNLRCKVAIAEGRIDDAIAILGQMYTQARHLGQDDFLVSSLVGVACSGIAWDDALYLLQHEDTPNLYWAFASIPRPAIDLSHCLAFERQFMYLQLKTMQEVDETPRPVGYWQGFMDRLAPEIGGLSREFGLLNLGNDPADVRAALTAFIAVAYPSAKRYLLEECGLSREQIEAYPTAQVVFLAIVRYHEESRDSIFKWSRLPYWQAVATSRNLGYDDSFSVSKERAGWIAAPATILLSPLAGAHAAVARLDQQLALLQTVEAIRMYGAASGGKLPPSLDDLPLPSPVDPFTGKPLDYRNEGTHAILSGHETPGLRYQLVLRFAEHSK